MKSWQKKYYRIALQRVHKLYKDNENMYLERIKYLEGYIKDLQKEIINKNKEEKKNIKKILSSFKKREENIIEKNEHVEELKNYLNQLITETQSARDNLNEVANKFKMGLGTTGKDDRTLQKVTERQKNNFKKK